ncbi:cytochrome [Parafrankia soli]|uniref:Cytochrome n=1 Tax=Parafrankia soli TaxID=2599596 RepID=A0A1S1PPJ7_9ACTN|nr:cytochrome P450 [Parafrankia soli]OHV22652.1 cytochrome [Parafrankia soli]
MKAVRPSEGVTVSLASHLGDVYYDPYDFQIDADPYPVWRRMRDEAPLYYNEKHDFYALSRFEDVERALSEWGTFLSGRGTLLEIIKANVPIPPGNILFEDPPVHHAHRGVMARVFTPKKMNALESKVREFCGRSLDPFVGTAGFDFIGDLGTHMAMRTIGYLLGIPEEDQEAIRSLFDDNLRIEDPDNPRPPDIGIDGAFVDYIEWRAEHPSDDLMTELMNAEFEDDTGTVRTLTRDEVIAYINLLAGAGNETTARLVGWAGKLIGEHADQRRELAADRSLIPNAVEEVLRYEAPSPVQARYIERDVEQHGQTIPAGSVVLLLNGSANRDERRFPDPDRFDIHRSVGRHLGFGYGIHHCLGAALARLEGRVALDEVLQRFPDWEVDWDNAVQARTSTVRGWEKMPVRIG